MAEDQHHQPTRLRGILLSVAAIVLALATVVTFVWLKLDAMQRQALCGKYMASLMGALVAYRTGEEVASPSGDQPARAAGDAHAARRITCQLFAKIARQQSIPVFLFRCPRTAFPAPPVLAPGPTPVDWGVSGPGVVTYAFDWAAPEDALATRVVMADRDPTAHGSTIMACFGDAHVKKLKRGAVLPLRGVGTLVTEGADGKPLGVSVGNPVAGVDDIYSAADDGGDPLTPGKGDPLRAWVK